MLEERPAEAERVELGGLDAVVVPAIAVSEEDGLTVVGDEAVFGDRDLADIASEVADHLLGAAEGVADVDVPGAARGIAEALVAGLVGDARVAFAQERLEFGEQLGLEDRLEGLEPNEVTAAVDEALRAKPTAGDKTVNVRVVAE